MGGSLLPPHILLEEVRQQEQNCQREHILDQGKDDMEDR